MDVSAFRPSPQDLSRMKDRMTFLYLEHCIIHRDTNAITARDDRGTVHIPAASLAVLLAGPGTTVSHQAMVLLAESGTSIVWVGEKGVRYYAHGRTNSRGTSLLESQAKIACNRTLRLAAARQMYSMRFESDDASNLTMQQLRGREGARVRKCYREQSERTGVIWRSRDYRPDDFSASDEINKALSVAHYALYGLVHSVIVALGCSPGLGFVHTGHDRSFVYDIADLYKAELSIPAAFDITALEPIDIEAAVRKEMRDRMHAKKLIETCIRDIKSILGNEEQVEESADVVEIWDIHESFLASGTNYESEIL